MKTEVIEGTVESASIKRANSKLSLFETIIFRMADGSERRLEKVAVAPSVAASLKPGTHGRFYFYKTIDHAGLIAVRTTDGSSAFAVPSGNERIMLIAAIAGLAWFIVVLATRGAVTFLGLAVGLLGVFMYFSYRKMRVESKVRYDANGGNTVVSS